VGRPGRPPGDDDDNDDDDDDDDDDEGDDEGGGVTAIASRARQALRAVDSMLGWTHPSRRSL
jgi:hypothetical protein